MPVRAQTVSDTPSPSVYTSLADRPAQIECLFDWVEGSYPSLFAPSGAPTAVWSSYSYRHYAATNAAVGVSSVDDHVYYLGPDSVLQDEGPLSSWLSVTGCQSPASPAALPFQADPAASLFIAPYRQVAESRHTRNWFDFGYAAEVVNRSSHGFKNVRASLSSLSPSTTVIDGDLSFGTVEASASVASQDTFTIRQDRTVPFNPSDLVWTIKSNAPPIAQAGADQTVPLGADVQLDGGASVDADGDALAFSWKIVSKPSGSAASLDNPMAAKPNITLDKPGSYVVELTVSDGQNSSEPDTVVVVTTGNSPPVANAGPDRTAYVGDLVQ